MAQQRAVKNHRVVKADRHHWGADAHGDGDIDLSDQSYATNNGEIDGNPAGYKVEADFNRDGVITVTDKNDAQAIFGAGAKAALANQLLSDASSDGPDNPIGYDGYGFNAESLQYTVRYRHYDPVLGKWMERDPIGYADGPNLYEYVTSNPTIGVDPFGLKQQRHSISSPYWDERTGQCKVKVIRYEVPTPGDSWNPLISYAPDNVKEEVIDGMCRKDCSWEGLANAAAAEPGLEALWEKQLGDINIVAVAKRELVQNADTTMNEMLGGAVSEAGAAVFIILKNGSRVRIVNGSLAGGRHPETGVPFKIDGHPDFGEWTMAEVNIGKFTNAKADRAKALKAMGLTEVPEGYILHHHEDGHTIQLVNADIHRRTGHTGGRGLKQCCDDN